MRKRVLGIVLATSFAIAAVGSPVAAAPNANACNGQVTSWAAQTFGGLHLGQYIDFAPPGQVKKFILGIICS